MKTIKQLSFVGLALAFILSSCSVEKRVYTAGYHVEWKNSKHNSNKQEIVKNNKHNEIKPENKVEPGATSAQIITSNENNSVINENSIMASTNKSIIVSQSPKVYFDKKSDKIIADENNLNTKTIVKANNKTIKKVLTASSGKAGIGLYILAIFIPWLAVGIYTGWKRPTLYNLLWTLLGYLPGIIHAFIVLNRGK